MRSRLVPVSSTTRHVSLENNLNRQFFHEHCTLSPQFQGSIERKNVYWSHAKLFVTGRNVTCRLELLLYMHFHLFYIFFPRYSIIYKIIFQSVLIGNQIIIVFSSLFFFLSFIYIKCNIKSSIIKIYVQQSMMYER